MKEWLGRWKMFKEGFPPASLWIDGTCGVEFPAGRTCILHPSPWGDSWGKSLIAMKPSLKTCLRSATKSTAGGGRRLGKTPRHQFFFLNILFIIHCGNYHVECDVKCLATSPRLPLSLLESNPNHQDHEILSGFRASKKRVFATNSLK